MRNCFPERLRHLRKESGLTMAQLAKKLGVTLAAVSDYERGKTSPSYAVLGRAADLFECQVDFLMGRSDQEPAIKRGPPKWLADLMPELEALGKPGQDAVKALVKGLKKEG